MIRAVIDTNILVRAVIMPHGTVGPVLLRLRLAHYILLYSSATLAEMVDVLNRPRIRDKYGLTEHNIETVIRLILLRGEAVTPTETIAACRDPKDDKFLEVAVAGRAEVIVSGDEDLRVLNPFRDIPIISAANFLRRLDEQQELN